QGAAAEPLAHLRRVRAARLQPAVVLARLDHASLQGVVARARAQPGRGAAELPPLRRPRALPHSLLGRARRPGLTGMHRLTTDLRTRAPRPTPAPAVIEAESPLDDAGANLVAAARR